jgi:hypothetical protein
MIEKDLKEIRELIEVNTEKWTKEQKEAALQTLNAVRIALMPKDLTREKVSSKQRFE